MSVTLVKKGSKVVALLVGLFLLFFSASLFSKPGANQGVQALPQKYAISLKGYSLSTQSNAVSDSSLSPLSSLNPAAVGRGDVDSTSTTSSPPQQPSPKSNLNALVKSSIRAVPDIAGDRTAKVVPAKTDIK